MKSVLVMCGIMVALTSIAHGQIYEWRDSQGVVHFTDDQGNIPPKYRDKVKVRESIKGDSVPAVPAQEKAGVPAAEDRGGSQPRMTYGGHDEAWWRNNFASLRQELKSIQNNLPDKKERLTALHRKRVIYQKSSDRVAYNELNEEIEKDEARIAALQGEITALEDEATKAGVPQSLWR